MFSLYVCGYDAVFRKILYSRKNMWNGPFGKVPSRLSRKAHRPVHGGRCTAETRIIVWLVYVVIARGAVLPFILYHKKKKEQRASWPVIIILTMSWLPF